MAKGPNRFVPSGKLKALELRQGSGIAVSNLGSGRFRYNNITDKLEASQNGGPSASLASIAGSLSVLDYGANPTGTGDNGGLSGPFVRAITAASTLGLVCQIPKGIYRVATRFWGWLPQSNVKIRGAGIDQTWIVQDFASGGNGTFVWLNEDEDGLHAHVNLTSDNVPGAVDADGFGLVEVDGPVPIGQICFLRNVGVYVLGNYYVARKCTGFAPPYLLALDRPIKKQFYTGDPIYLEDTQPTNVEISDFTISGTGDRYVDIWGGVGCKLKNIRMTSDYGVLEADSLGVSFNYGHDNYAEHVFGDCGTLANSDVVLFSEENTILVHCGGINGQLSGCALYQCDECDVYSPDFYNNLTGLTFGADGNVVGCRGCNCFGGSLDNNGTGILVGRGSSDIGIFGTSVRFCYSIGAHVYEGGPSVCDSVLFEEVNASDCPIAFAIGPNQTNIRILDCNADRAATKGLDTYSTVDVSGLTCRGGTATSKVCLNAGSYTAYIRGLVTESAVLNCCHIDVQAGVRAYIDADLAQDTNTSNNMVHVVGVGIGERVTVSGTGAAGSVGWNGAGGGTTRWHDIRLGLASSYFDGAHMRDRGAITMTEATPVALAFTDLSIDSGYPGVGDQITLVPYDNNASTEFSQPLVTPTNGVGFSIVGKVGNKQKYYFKIG